MKIRVKGTKTVLKIPTYYHGTNEQAADSIMRHGFRVPKSSPGVSVSDEYEMARSYADRGDEDVIHVRAKHGRKPIKLKSGVDVLTGEYVYRPEDLKIIGRGKKKP